MSRCDKGTKVGMSEEEMKSFNEAHDLARKVMGMCTMLSSGKYQKEFVKRLVNDHPTCQQAVANLFRMFFVELAKKDHTDLRNESAVRLAKDVAERMKDSLPFF